MRLSFTRLRAAFSLLALLTLPLITTSCARTPTVAGTAGGSVFLLVTMTVRGQIQPNDATIPYYYFCLINLTDSPSAPGPIPVTGIPWGNGFAAASQSSGQGFVGYVLYNRFQGQGGYGLYATPRDGNGNFIPASGVALPQFISLGQPDAYRTPQLGETLLSFRVDLNRLKRNATDPLPPYLQFNLLATDKIPNNADQDTPKLWDALGNGTLTGTLNYFITLPTEQNIQRSNANLIGDSQEPANDVRDRSFGSIVNDPNLDIVDWSVEIRRE